MTYFVSSKAAVNYTSSFSVSFVILWFSETKSTLPRCNCKMPGSIVMQVLLQPARKSHLVDVRKWGHTQVQIISCICKKYNPAGEAMAKRRTGMRKLKL